MSRPQRRKRWGVRTLVYLGIAAASIIISNWMRLSGNDDVILLPFLGLVVGLTGATVCTVRGLKASGGRLPRD
jgi:hypothetical protein